MNGKEILVDTNIALYLLAGSKDLESYLEGKIIHVSFMSELELIGYKNITDQQEVDINELLSDCFIVPLSDGIKQKYIELRRKYKLKLADAVIAATAIVSGIPIITADTDFRKITELDIVTYSHGTDLTR